MIISATIPAPVRASSVRNPELTAVQKCQSCPFFKPSANRVAIGFCEQHQETVRGCDAACATGVGKAYIKNLLS